MSSGLLSDVREDLLAKASIFGGAEGIEERGTGSVLYAEGEFCDGVFLLLSGKISLSISAPNGVRRVLRAAEPGEVLGLGSVITGKPYDATAETIEPTSVIFICREDFLRFLAEDSKTCIRVLEMLSREVKTSYELMRTLGSTVARARV